MEVSNLSRNRQLAQNVESAATFWRRLRGLMFRSELSPGAGLLIYPCNSVHTMHMRFSIDVIFLDKAGLVIGFEQDIQPWRIGKSHSGAWYALELPAGSIAASGTQIGDQIELGDIG